MEAQLHRPQDTGLHSGEGQGQVHDEGEHHHKQSVLKKVKAKAKKIKDHLKHGLGHEHDHGHEQEYHSLQGDEEEESDDEEMEEGAEVHGGPYAIKSKDIPKEDIVPMGNLENPTSPKEDRYDSKIGKIEEVHRPILQRQDEFARPPSLEGTHFPEERHRSTFAETQGIDDHVTALGKHEHQGLQGHENVIGAPTDASHFYEQVHRPPARGEPTDQGVQGHKFKVLTGLEEDPHVPKDRPNPTNYQSKVTDPTGDNNEETGVSPLVQSFGKMDVNDVPETTGIRTEPRGGDDIKFDQGTEHSQYTGSHDQFAPQESPVDFPSVREETESIPKSVNPNNPEDLPQDTLTGKPGSYTEKISSATSAIADKAVAAKNAVASKLGYGGTGEGTREGQVTGGDKDATKTTSATALAQKYASTMTGKLAPVYEKVAGAGSTVMAKVTGHENREGADAEHEVKTDKGVSMKEYLSEKFKPGEEDKALSEVISGSLSRQKDKTEAAKPMGTVTESEEVERRLGSIGETKKEDEVASGETKVGEGFGQGVVDRVKGAVSTWLGKGGEAQANDSAGDGGAVVGGSRG